MDKPAGELIKLINQFNAHQRVKIEETALKNKENILLAQLVKSKAFEAEILSQKAIADNNPTFFIEAAYLINEGVEQSIKQLKEAAKSVNEMQKAQAAEGASLVLINALESLNTSWIERNKAIDELDESGQRMIIASRDIGSQALQGTNQTTHQTKVSLEEASWLTKFGLPIALVASAIIGIFIAIRISRSFSRPIKAMIHELAQGSEAVNTAASSIMSSSSTLADGAMTQSASPGRNLRIHGRDGQHNA